VIIDVKNFTLHNFGGISFKSITLVSAGELLVADGQKSTVVVIDP
jgi:hypothetical protein